MATYTTRVKLTSDRRITVEVPEDMPLGDAEVTVKVGEGGTVGERSGTIRGWPANELLAWLEREHAIPKTWSPRTKEEIDAEINSLRDEWDDD